MSAAEAPALEIRGARATITLRRTSQHNRIDADDPSVILEHLAQIERTPDVRVLVITGQGTRTFCAGYTLTQISSRLDSAFEDMLDRLESVRVPTLCALNGGVYGGGTDLAMCCDLRIGVTGCRMFMPAARLGLHYYPGGIRRFVSRLGPTATKKIFLTGATLHADEMLRIGFLSELVQPDELAARVDAHVTAIEEGAPGVLASMKRHIDALARGLDFEAEGRRAYEHSLRSSAALRELAQRA